MSLSFECNVSQFLFDLADTSNYRSSNYPGFTVDGLTRISYLPGLMSGIVNSV